MAPSFYPSRRFGQVPLCVSLLYMRGLPAVGRCCLATLPPSHCCKGEGSDRQRNRAQERFTEGSSGANFFLPFSISSWNSRSSAWAALWKHAVPVRFPLLPSLVQIFFSPGQECKQHFQIILWLPCMTLSIIAAWSWLHYSRVIILSALSPLHVVFFYVHRKMAI